MKRNIRRVRVLDDIRTEDTGSTVIWGDESDEDAEVVEVVVDHRAKFPIYPGLALRDHASKGMSETQVRQYGHRMARLSTGPYASRQNIANLGMGKDRVSHAYRRWLRRQS